ncbi:MAG: hypothetical protein E7259_00545 [Lachnospiraceae bacterium]|nr:hypothetical protein [Lachnospiraceae bacterium]
MKLITLNTHSLLEENYEEKLIDFVYVIAKERPEVFALQEVNQSIDMSEVDGNICEGYVEIDGESAIIREDNHALKVAKMLFELGLKYEWTFTPIKRGYGRYEECVAIFSLSPIIETKQFYVSEIKDYNNWRSRKILGIKTADYGDTWFFSAHFGWWDDEEEPFLGQWDNANGTIKDIIGNDTCFIMGDFNTPAKIRNQGYDYVKKSGWNDTWELAEFKDSGLTVGHVIDGWHDRIKDEADKAIGMRLDYVWCNKAIEVLSSRVIFNGKNYNVVSDHYGVMVEIECD